MNPAPKDSSVPSSTATVVFAKGALVLSAPLLAIAFWCAAVSVTDADRWAAILVTVAIVVPVAPAIILAVVALRVPDPQRARALAVIAMVLVTAVPLVAAWLGLA